MEQGMLGRLVRAIRFVFAAENLDQRPEITKDRSRTSLLGMITAREVLPEDKTGPVGKRSLLAWLFQGEALPFDHPPPTTGRTSFLGMLLSRERLPEDPAPGSGKGRTTGGGR